VAGETSSSNFPRVVPFQNALSGSSDAFVSKLGGFVALAFSAGTPTPDPVGAGNDVVFKYTIDNSAGDATSGIVFSSVMASGGNFKSANASPSSAATCGTTASGNPATVTCVLVPLAAGATVTMNVTVTPTAGTALNNSASVLAPGLTSPLTANASVGVADFGVEVTPTSRTVAAGTSATYSVKVSSNPANINFPNALTLSSSCSGLPTGAHCEVANGSIANLKNGPQSRTVVVSTTARTTTTTSLFEGRHLLYALWLPFSGLAFAGLGRVSPKRRVLLALICGGALALLVFLPACGSSSKSTTTTTGTPAGTYTFTISVSSGSVTRTQRAELVVQ
jgi:hypothetical protein